MIANPLYSTQFGNRTYAFTHGYHFKDWVTDPSRIQSLVLLKPTIKRIVGLNIKPCDATKCTSLNHLEEVVAPFLDSLWVSSGNIPTGKSDRYWSILKFLSSFIEIGRPTPIGSSLFSYDDLKINKANGRIKKLDNTDLDGWRKYFLPHMLNYLSAHLSGKGLKLSDLTFVYGDTHTGGWREETSFDFNGSKLPIRVYNTGGWTTHDRGDHPACHIFVVDSNDKEYMLDISFDNVWIGDQKLIEIAAQDAENNNALLRKDRTVKAINKKLLTSYPAMGAPSGSFLFRNP
jgi:hypothetical protein